MAKPTACIFTLNSKHEPRAFKNYFEKQGVHVENPVSTDPSKKTDITELFKRFVEQKANSGEKCDLITISGHHSGSFWGDNTFGQLDLKSIYEMSCNPKYKDFFNNIKAWWLLGCQWADCFCFGDARKRNGFKFNGSRNWPVQWRCSWWLLFWVVSSCLNRCPRKRVK